MQLGIGKLTGAVNGDKQAKLAFCRADFSDIDVEVTDRIAFELFLRGVSPARSGKRLMPCRVKHRWSAARVRWGRVACKAYRQSSSGSSVCRRNATISAFAAFVSTVECGCFGPIGASWTDGRVFHVATVLGLYNDPTKLDRIIPTTPLDLLPCVMPFSVRKERPVVSLLHPGDQP